MPKSRNFSVLERNCIIILHEEGYSQRQIAEKVRGSQTGVGDVIRRYKSNKMGDDMKDCPRPGRPRITSRRQDRILRRLSLQNRKKNAVQLRKEWAELTGKNVSSRTTRRRLVQHGLRSRKARRKPLISPAQKRKRFVWAKIHRQWSKRQ